jgi:predicted lipoprotein with Yx(FWY)xxD motif
MRPTLLIAAAAVSVLLAACGSGKSSTSNTATTSTSGSSPTVKSTSNAKLGQTILVDSHGMTLYRLSGESSGKFVCVSSCLSAWHPLTVPSGTTPSGSVGSLSVIKRPDGSSQVAYHGMPLYTFAQDKAAGEANGQGFKDVGTWMAVTVSGSASPGTAGSSSEQSGSGGYGY